MSDIIIPQNYEWLKERKKGIGASDAAGVLGLSRWKTPLSVYLEKIGSDISLLEVTAPIEWGHRLEAVIAHKFSEKNSIKLSPKEPETPAAILKHKEYDFIRATPDYLFEDGSSFLEVKTASLYKLDEWQEEEIPIEYLIQLNHTMAVTGHDYCYIAVLVGGQNYIEKRIERDESVIKTMIAKEIDFWQNHVLKLHPPEVTDMDTDSISFLFSTPNDETIELSDDIDSLLEDLNTLKDMSKKLEDQKKELQAKICAAIGNNVAGVSKNYRASWKPISTARFDSKAFKKDHSDIYHKYVKETSSRRFTFKKLK